MKFIKYFVLEFAIIFLIASAVGRLLKVPFNLFNLLLSSAASGAVIAYALVWSYKGQRG